MSTNQIIIVVFVLFGCILGWKPITNILGPLRLRIDVWNMGALEATFATVHALLIIVLSMTLGYIFFLIFLIKFIIARVARAKEKKAVSDYAQNARNAANAQNNAQNSSEGDTTSEENTTNI